MRLSTLAWLVVAPLLIACGADTAATRDDGTGPGGPRKPGSSANGDDPSNPAADPTAPGAPAAAASIACTAQPTCTGASGPPLGALRDFTHSFVSPVIVASGPAFHRGRDQILSVGDPQWIIGKFTYSYIDKALEDEEVDIFVERGCGGAWEKLGTVATTGVVHHATVEGVDDSDGRVYFQIPKANELGVGRHRVRLVVAGDHTFTDLLMDVVPKGSPIVVSDVDGTLTDSENSELMAVVSGTLPGVQPKAAEALSTLAAKGYHVVYLTARPEWLTGRTHEFLDANSFPRGVVHTTTGLTGVSGTLAAVFKAADMAMLASHGHKLEWGFGNMPSDVDAYESAKIPINQRVFLSVADARGARNIQAYSEILPSLSALPAACK